jgi:hypothetical protein
VSRTQLGYSIACLQADFFLLWGHQDQTFFSAHVPQPWDGFYFSFNGQHGFCQCDVSDPIARTNHWNQCALSWGEVHFFVTCKN